MTKVESYLNDAFDQLGEHEQDAVIAEAIDKGCNTLTALAQSDDADCQMKVEPFYQCCCNCVYLKPVHFHCCTKPTPTGKPRKSGECFCKVQKGWACVGPEGGEGIGRIYDNWPKHSCGCEEYTPKDNGSVVKRDITLAS